MSGVPEPALTVIDFEGSRDTGVVEAGIVVVDGNAVGHCVTELYSPHRGVPVEDERRHGLNDAGLEGCPRFQERYATMVEFRRRGVFCAHNASVEDNLLRSHFSRPPIVPDWRRPSSGCAEWSPWIDTLTIYRRLYPKLPDYRLGSLISLFGQQERLEDHAEQFCPPARRNYHCALFDALASACLIMRLYDAQILAPGDWHRLLWWSGHNQQTELWG